MGWAQVTRVLVVDRDPIVRSEMSAVLTTGLGADVASLGSSRLATEFIQREGFDLAVLEVTLEPHSGVELARRAANRNIPSLLCSKYPEAMDQLKEFDFPHLIKPFKDEDLLFLSAAIIATTAENVRRVRSSCAKLQKTAIGLESDLQETRRLLYKTFGLDLPDPIRKKPWWRMG